MRTFKDAKGIRSPSEGKIDWYGVNNILVDESFGRYMKKHTLTEDGTLREYTNWWSVWDRKISLQSLLRHMKDLEACEYGLIVVKEYTEQGENTLYLTEKEFKTYKTKNKFIVIDEEDCINACKFNLNAMNLRLIKEGRSIK